MLKRLLGCSSTKALTPSKRPKTVYGGLWQQKVSAKHAKAAMLKLLF
jgi:uncharacterized protein YebE (UPF0316 family)